MKPGDGKKVLLAMSGGVDSSVAAAILTEDGYEVVGCFMRMGTPAAAAVREPTDSATARCCSADDAADARLVAAMLDIRLYVLDFSLQFGRVIDQFAAEYNAGRTPNPCIRCNNWLKFGALVDHARTIDADCVATGHHARVDRSARGRPRLLRGRDSDKDQSYVLFGLTHEQLARTILPAGEYGKEQIRQIARQLDLPVADKAESQEICFVPDDDYASLVRSRTPEAFRPGDILDQQGNRIGQHKGHQHFTIGQRRGVGVAVGAPIYVVDKDAEGNTITVGPKQSLLAGGLIAAETNWLIPPPIGTPITCQVKIRYNGTATPATVQAVGEGGLEVNFDKPVSAVTPGQAVVCYDGDEVLGGGWIERGLCQPDDPR